jgi:hypothetical protein
MQTYNIGRNTSNQIVLNDNMVSRQHAQIVVLDNGEMIIKDLGSSNGTFVNGNRINEYQLKPGDIVKCANVFLNWQQHINSTNQNSNYTSSVKNSPPIRNINQNYAKEPNQKEQRFFISSSIIDNLPAMVRNELATLSAQKQEEFLEEYKRKRKSVALAYILMLPFFFMLHYGYLRKWGLQFLFWITGGGFFVWWFIDLFRTYGMVQDFNKDVAVDVIRNLKAISNY